MSMGGNAATKALRVVDNVERILAIELMNASQAIEFRRPAKTSPYLEEFLADFRKVVPFVEEDIIMYQAIDRAVAFIREGDFISE